MHESDAPTTFKIAISKLIWQEIMFEEITALQLQGTWSLVPPLSDKNIVGVQIFGQYCVSVYVCYVTYILSFMRHQFYEVIISLL